MWDGGLNMQYTMTDFEFQTEMFWLISKNIIINWLRSMPKS